MAGQKPLRQLSLQALATCVINIQCNNAPQLRTLKNGCFVPSTCHMYGVSSFLLLIFIRVYEDYF